MIVRTLLFLLLCITPPVLAQEDGQQQGEEPNVLTVYTYGSFASEWGPGPKIKQAFEPQCECELRFVLLDSSTDMLGRIRSEGEGSQADVLLGLDNSLIIEAQNSGLIAPHKVDMRGLDLPLPWDNQNFLPFDFGFFAFVYDTFRTPSPPTSFEELLNAKDTLRIAIQDPRTSTVGFGLLLWIKAIYGDDALEAWDRLSAKVVKVTEGWSEAYGLFLAGEADMVLSYTTSPAYHMITEEEAKYQAASFKEGHGMQVEVAAILKNAPNPELADQFMQFIASDSFQAFIPTGNWMYPVIFPKQGLPAAFGELVQPTRSLVIDAQGIADNKADWIDEFNQILGGQ